MKKVILLTAVFSILISVPSVFAQQTALPSSPFNSQSMNGTTGLYSVSTAHVGWENKSNFGFDVGYRAVINGDAGVSHIPALTLSFFKMLEISAAYDIQQNNYYSNNKERNNDDLLLGLKIKIPTKKNTSIAFGTTIQLINVGNDYNDYQAYQPYIAVTYTGNFFNMPASTTVMFGKTFYSGGPGNNTNIDFGMGFDLILFPSVFKETVHWIIDFANFGYSDNSWPNNSFYHTGAVHRGILNTGFRFNLSAIPPLNKVKLVIDVVFNDLFDAGARSFTAGAVFGFSP